MNEMQKNGQEARGCEATAALIILTDETGRDLELEQIDRIDYEGEEYVILLPTDEEREEVIIMQIDEDADKEDSLTSVKSERILDEVFEIFKERHATEFNFSD